MNEPIAYLISYKKKSDPTIFQSSNLLFSMMFGFSKENIIGKEISIILPNLYAKIHENLINKLKEKILLGNYSSTYINTTQERYAKSSSGYIFLI